MKNQFKLSSSPVVIVPSTHSHEISAEDRQEAVTLLRDLVEAESINPPGDTVRAAGVAGDWLTRAELPFRLIHAHPNKPNIVASTENGVGSHVILNAHLDTVLPGDVSVWSKPPLELTEIEDRLYGLGTGNMKAAAAAMMIAYRRLISRGHDWAGRLTLTLVADECVFGDDGAAYLLKTEPDLLGDMLICGEGPGELNVAIAEKGLLWVRINATGPVGQGMLTQRGFAATARLAGALREIDEWNDRVIACPLPELDHARNREGMRLSANIGRIGGGDFFSASPSNAWAEIDFRLPPGLTLAELRADLDRVCSAECLSWDWVKGWEANWSAPDSPVVSAIRAAAKRTRGEKPADVTRLPASDASRWRQAGIPAVCFGPQPELASGVDDHVNKRDFFDCCDIYTDALLNLLAR